MTDTEWEARCDGCGKCCVLPGTNVACPGLDTCSNRCTVYEKRTTTELCSYVTPGNVANLHASGVLPGTCAYVRWMLDEKPWRLPQEEIDKIKAKPVPFMLGAPAIQAEYLRQRRKRLGR